MPSTPSGSQSKKRANPDGQNRGPRVILLAETLIDANLGPVLNEDEPGFAPWVKKRSVLLSLFYL
jgi:hypothetical protein